MAAPGWFGKLSVLGDFASRRLETDWVAGCDRWLSESLTASRQALGDRWLDAYLSAPVWRFAWAPGVVDGHWWFGVLMPSCDRVGRYFPLVVAQQRTHAPADRFALEHLDLWWSHLADAALATLADDATLEAFEAALEQAPPWPSPRHPHWLAPQSGGVSDERYTVAAGATLVDVAGTLATQGLLARLQGCSLWWPVSGPQDAGHCTLQRGLPPATAFASLITGRW